jgi:hypothetical protein
MKVVGLLAAHLSCCGFQKVLAINQFGPNILNHQLAESQYVMSS